ncbi:MAG: hypothetical protein ACRCV3_03225 [Desulfovibrionaceae bacterium]
MNNVTKNTDSILSFKKGIAGVSFPHTADVVTSTTSGKSGHVSSPSSSAPSGASQATLYASDIEIRLKAFLQPRITIQSILQPFIYNRTLRLAKKKLIALRKTYSSFPAFEKSIAILEEDEELKNLLQMYRNLLYKG